MESVPQRARLPLTGSSAASQHKSEWERRLIEFSHIISEISGGNMARTSSPESWAASHPMPKPVSSQNIEPMEVRHDVSNCHEKQFPMRKNWIEPQQPLYIKCQKTKMAKEEEKEIKLNRNQFYKPERKLQSATAVRAGSAPARVSGKQHQTKQAVIAQFKVGESMFELFRRQELESSANSHDIFDNSHIFKSKRSQSARSNTQEPLAVDIKLLMKSTRKPIVIVNAALDSNIIAGPQIEGMEMDSAAGEVETAKNAEFKEYANAKSSLEQYLASRRAIEQ